MPPVTVLVLHARPAPDAGPLERLLDDARGAVADRLSVAFAEAGADDVRVVAGPPDDLAFGDRLARLVAETAGGHPRRRRGLVVLGAGSIPLARPRDLRAFVTAAASDERVALANNRYSADVVAIGRADRLPAIPPLPGDNALPRWLEEAAGWQVGDLRRRWRLAIDLDSPLDVLLVARTGMAETHRDRRNRTADRPAVASQRLAVASERLAVASERLAALATALGDRRAQVVVAGRTSARSLRWLERRSTARIRALVEERGLRASTTLALAGHAPAQEANGRPTAGPDGVRVHRPPRSILGLLLDRDGPAALGRILGELGDAAVVDSRVLLAHRLGADEARWPSAEDRFASDLLDPGAIADPWLRDLTAAALDAPIPVLLGGHTLVGPGVRLVARGARAATPASAPVAGTIAG